VNTATPKTKNHYNKMEWAGAFGDVGTLIPFVAAYITILGSSAEFMGNKGPHSSIKVS